MKQVRWIVSLTVVIIGISIGLITLNRRHQPESPHTITSFPGIQTSADNAVVVPEYRSDNTPPQPTALSVPQNTTSSSEEKPSSQSKTQTGTASTEEPKSATTDQSTPTAKATPYDSLPSISYWQDHKTDQFLVDMEVIASGHPYKGVRATSPHAGAHIHFGDDYLSWPRGGNSSSDYPPIYAVVNGVIDMIEAHTHVGENDRYGVSLAIAKDGSAIWDLDYSIEPMTPEPSANFYQQFMTVKKGDPVKKGQIIAYMYLPKEANGTHIHFHLRKSDHQSFFAPAIFSTDIIQAFRAHWANFGLDGGEAIPVCMGWKLSADENPFGGDAVDCL